MSLKKIDAADIELQGVQKRYQKGKFSLEATDLLIHSGEFFSLLGPSGCGKTTTLRLIGGFETATDGVIRIGDEVVTNTPPERRDVNMVFQSYALFPHLTIFDNIAFGLKRKRASKSEIYAQVTEMMQLVELDDYAKAMPAELSGGQRQRVALARALVNKPRALLLDEPLSALDLKLRKTMQAELKRIQREVGITFVFVTHDQGEALALSDRVAVMNHGKIEQVGSPEELYEEPKNRFVADFIGTSNFLYFPSSMLQPGKVLLPNEQHIQLQNFDVQQYQEGIEVGIRPERVIMSQNPTSLGNSLQGVVQEVDFTGYATQYTVQVLDGQQMSVLIPRNGEGAYPYSRGETVWLNWQSKDSRMYGASAGEK